MAAAWFATRIVDCTRCRNCSDDATATATGGANNHTTFRSAPFTVALFIPTSMHKGAVTNPPPTITNLRKQSLTPRRQPTPPTQQPPRS